MAHCGDCQGMLHIPEHLCFMAEAGEVTDISEACPQFAPACCDDEEHYCPSATAGDYRPGNPWDAPGMSIRDFI